MTRDVRPSSSARPLPPGTAIAFAIAYVVLAWASRLTTVDGRTTSLVFPAAGLAVLWLLAESPRHQLRVLVPLVAAHAAVVSLTGASAPLAALGATSMGVQTWLFGVLVRRWCPELLGAGGGRSIRSPRLLVLTAAAAAAACTVGAAIGAVGITLDGVDPDPVGATLHWFARHACGILAVGGVGHLAWEWRTQAVPDRARGGGRGELVALWSVSALVTLVVFAQPLPLAFLVVLLPVWAAARYATFTAALLCVAIGFGGLAATVLGHGPFTVLDDRSAAAFVSQVFVGAVLLAGLAVGALSDRVDGLFAAELRTREQSVQQAELLAEMTESMGEGLVVLDEHGHVERSNGASRRLARRVHPGAGDEQSLAALVTTLLHPDPAQTSVTRGELGVGDVVIALPTGEEMVIAVTSAPLRRRGDAGVRGRSELLVLREVTEHRSGLRPLASFATTAAHDLRGPLSAIRSWLSLGIEELEDDSPAAMPIRRAETAAVHMRALIDDLLEHAMAESGELSAADVELGGEDGALAATADLLGPDDVLVVDGELPAVHVDPVALRQLLGNLVGNAVKYARPGVPAEVRVRAYARGSRVVVEICDNGVGVDEAERAVIFQRFHRSGAVRAHFRGTGMGLTICQTVVQRHGGTIECVSPPEGPGSVFRFDLPAATGG